jgi:hypothetical protein
VDTVALAALPAAAGFTFAAAAVVFAGGKARRLADAVAIGRAGLIAAAVEAAILAGLAAIIGNADAVAILRFRTDALVFSRLAGSVAATLIGSAAIGAA